MFSFTVTLYDTLDTRRPENVDAPQLYAIFKASLTTVHLVQSLLKVVEV